MVRRSATPLRPRDARRDGTLHLVSSSATFTAGSPHAPAASATGLQRLLIAVPNWVGDVVMAGPVLAAIRRRLPEASVGLLLRDYVREILDGAGWNDIEHVWPRAAGLGSPGLGRLAQEIRGRRYDAVLLLTNSFRSAWLARRTGIPRRIGYARDGRGWLLTDRLRPRAVDGEYVPTPILDYYAALAESLGCPVDDRRLRLTITSDQAAAGRALLGHYGIGDAPYAVINPGAAFGAAKCWLPTGFAAVCDRLHADYGWRSLIVGAPGEAGLMRSIASFARSGPTVCDNPGTTLGSLKFVIANARALICNDTGPRHYGNAFSVPTVTIFGPTHQAWTDAAFPTERRLQAAVPCGPCQLKVCPFDHRCMSGVSATDVLEALADLLSASPSSGGGA